MNRTVSALIQRGFPSILAEQLKRNGYTLGKLKKTRAEDLEKLGIPLNCIESLREGRPPIPSGMLSGLLRSCSHTCCWCNDRSKGVVVHHMIPWSKVREHEEENLIVLCPDCHDRAHTRSELTKNVTVDDLKHYKNVWMAKVAERATDMLFSKHPEALTSVWDYFNRQKLLGFGNRLRIDLTQLPGYQAFCDYQEPPHETNWYCNSGYLKRGVDQDDFYEALLYGLLHLRGWINLTENWSRLHNEGFLKEKDVFVHTANHRFRRLQDETPGPGQDRVGWCQKNKTRVEFYFDAYECTSASARGYHLTDSRKCTFVGMVRTVAREGGILKITATCLAIGVGFAGCESESVGEHL